MHIRFLPLITAAALTTALLCTTFAALAGATSPCATLAAIHPIGALSLPASASPAYLAGQIAKVRSDAASTQRDQTILRAQAARLGTARPAALSAAADFTRLHRDEIALYHTEQSLAAASSPTTASNAANEVRTANSAAITAAFAIANLRANAIACR